MIEGPVLCCLLDYREIRPEASEQKHFSCAALCTGEAITELPRYNSHYAIYPKRPFDAPAEGLQVNLPQPTRTQWLAIWITTLLVSTLWLYAQPIKWRLARASVNEVIGWQTEQFWTDRYQKAESDVYRAEGYADPAKVIVVRDRRVRSEAADLITQERKKVAKVLAPIAAIAGLLAVWMLRFAGELSSADGPEQADR